MASHLSDPAALAQPELPQPPFQADGHDSSLSDHGEEGNIDVFNYDPVPPKKIVLVSVRYHPGSRGQPLPYSVNESDGEWV